jgi:Protein NO VEIN, C-terminal
LIKRGEPWAREEDVLAFSLYAKRGVADDKDPAVINLSQMTGRSVGSVVRKLANFLAVETKGRKGLKHFATMDEQVYLEFRNRPAELATEAQHARDAYRSDAEAHRDAVPAGDKLRPKWVFQAREFKDGRKYYSLKEELPRILRRDPSKRVVHWESAEHRYTPFPMNEGDIVLLFQGATKDYSARGFYGHGVICNLDGKCAAPVGETGRHNETNRHNRAIGVDLKYLDVFLRPILPSIRPSSPLANMNLQKLVAGGREGSAQETVFAVTAEDWARISKHFATSSASTGGQAIRKGRGGWKTIDPERKVKIEASAVNLSRTHFENLGYEVTSVERDNRGWDLEAEKNGFTLRLEVKGLSGTGVSIELTPNEYKHVKARPPDYRICVVTEALQRPLLRVYSYTERSRHWEDEDGDPLDVSEITGARMFRP